MLVGVNVGVRGGVIVGVKVGVLVGLLVGVNVGVRDGVIVGVKVGAGVPPKIHDTEETYGGGQEAHCGTNSNTTESPGRTQGLGQNKSIPL